MKEEFEQKLMNEFPWMESRGWNTGKKLNEPIFIECGDGWSQIIHNMCKKLHYSYEKMSKEEQDNFYVMQIKEKLGGLRVYPSLSNNETNQIIDEAEIESYKTCERCGIKGELRKDRPYIQVLCDDCNKKNS